MSVIKDLYTIDDAILSCLSEIVINDETGEVEDVIDTDKLTALAMERDQKIENIALWIKNLKAEEQMLKAEKLAYEKRQKSVNNLKEYLTDFLNKYLDGEKFKTTKCCVSYRTSDSVDITDITKVDRQFLRFKEPEADKNAIKKLLRKGVAVDGARLIEKRSVTIK